jgi:Cu+-exporting ATPase
VNQIERAYFKVVGMYCITCKLMIKKQLKNENGIRKIGVDYMTDNVVVDYDSALINIEEIKERLEKSGYKFILLAR